MKSAVSAAGAELKGSAEELRPVVKDAVTAALEGLKDIGANVQENVEKAVKEGNLSAERIKKITARIISGAVEAAEEGGKEVKEVASGAFEGTRTVNLF